MTEQKHTPPPWVSEKSTVTRVEVIDQSGRAYIVTDAKGVTVAFQDDDRTLKVFIEGEKKWT